VVDLAILFKLESNNELFINVCLHKAKRHIILIFLKCGLLSYDFFLFFHF